MTEKSYNPEQKQAKTKAKMDKMDKSIRKKNDEIKPQASAEKKIDEKETEVKKTERAEEIKKEGKEKVQKKKKEEAVVRGMGIPISSKHSFAISKFIKNKEVGKAISELEEILLHKRALPMKGEIPHRKGIMSGRYPRNATRHFIKLLKSLNSNASVNEIANPVITEAHANFASRPFGKFGRVRKKRSNIILVAREKKADKNKKEKNK